MSGGLKLYSSKRAPNPRRVRWVMAEKSIEDIEIVEVDIMKGEHRSQDFIPRAGLPLLPILELDDGTTLTESVAICRYLESIYPEPNLFGHDPKETAIIEMWSRRAEIMVAMPLMMAVRHEHPAFGALEKQVPEVGSVSRTTAERALKIFDRQLGQSEFLAADRLTIADIIAFTGLDFGRLVRFRPRDELVDLSRWQAAMRQRSAAEAGA